MTQALVLQKVAGKDTVAHESMHVAAFIYYLIKYYPELNNRKLLDEIFEWTLDSVTIISTDEYKGQFCHRNWGRFTEQANVYCCLAGMIGGYIYSNDILGLSTTRLLSLLNFAISEDMDSEKLERYYEIYGAGIDLKNSNIVEYRERLKYIKEILSLLNGKSVFNDLLNDCMKQLENKRTLYKDDLVSLAQKHKENIICETFKQQRVCVSITEKGPKYSYFK